jgi:serine/threonine-protein kinase HipA
MVNPVDLAKVFIWDHFVGAVVWDRDKDLGRFEFDRGFAGQSLNLAPIMMSVGSNRGLVHEFPALSRETFHGLPGMLADCLPDKYGNRLIDAWLARQGRDPGTFSPVERLCYTGARGMGALEFQPAKREGLNQSVEVDVGELVALAKEVLDHRNSLRADLSDEDSALVDILRVGTSAGGARAKAILSIHEKSGVVRSGQVKAPKGYGYWILKFDGIADEQLGPTQGYGRIEYAYYRMASECGIEMTECRLYKEGGRAHFMTRRFDRTAEGEKTHMQSLTGIAHYDFNMAGAYGYEQAFQIMRRLRLPYHDAEQQFRRMVFNVLARNQDDHPKNIGFLMNRNGKWRLSPAYDVIYSHNPEGSWTNKHQMTINGKRDGFTREDILGVAKAMNIKHAGGIIDEIHKAVSLWPKFAAEAGVPEKRTEEIYKEHGALN